MVFGAYLDGLVWELLRTHDLAPPTEPTIDHPYWRGVFWAIWPPRDRVAGLNELHTGRATLVMVWTTASQQALRALADDPTLPAALDALVDGTPLLASTSDLVRLALTKGDRPAVALVDDTASGPTAAHGRAIADAVVATVAPGGELLDATALHHLDRRAAAVIVTHELIWDVVDAYVTGGLIERPSALDDPPWSAELLRPLLLVRRAR